MPEIEVPSVVTEGRRTRIDPYAVNPIADDYRGVNAETYAVALGESEPPRLFGNGRSHVPTTTASGLDPERLLDLPYAIRHAVAAEPDPAVVHGLIEQYGHDPHARIDHEGLTAAIRRVSDWASGKTYRDAQKENI
ncbi:hypothetical protein GCM10028777_24970 [Angustibacter speluncae]